jgi:hypothetical protein
VALAGVRVAGTTPVPVRLEVCGLLLALSLTLSCPVSVPVAAGMNVTLIVHLTLAARLVVQVVAETAKSPVVEIASPKAGMLRKSSKVRWAGQSSIGETSRGC